MLECTIKGDAKIKKALHFTLQASMPPPLRANCARSVPHHGGGRQEQGARATRQPAPCPVGVRPSPQSFFFAIAIEHRLWRTTPVMSTPERTRRGPSHAKVDLDPHL